MGSSPLTSHLRSGGWTLRAKRVAVTSVSEGRAGEAREQSLGARHSQRNLAAASLAPILVRAPAREVFWVLVKSVKDLSARLV